MPAASLPQLNNEPGIGGIRTEQDLARFIQKVMRDTGAVDLNAVNGLPGRINNITANYLLKALASGHIFVGNGSNVAADVAMSGDVTIDSTGLTTIGALTIATGMIKASAVTTAKIADNSVNNNKLADGVKNNGLVTALPGTPTTGDQCIYTDSLTAPTFAWHLVYDGSQTAGNRWLCIGGSPQFAEVATSESTASTSYTNLTTTGPSITVPLAGDYEVEIGATIFSQTNDVGGRMSYAIGGTGAVDADSLEYHPGNSKGLFVTTYHGGVRPRVKTGLSASTALVAKYKASGAATISYVSRWMRVRPVRVG